MSNPLTLPPGRYGRPKRPVAPRRWRTWLLTAAALAVGVLLAVLAYVNLGGAPITAERIGFDELPGNRMEITLTVRRDDDTRPAVCIVRVRDATGAETGRRELFVPPGTGDRPLRTVIRSGTRPVTADVFGCSYEVPEYLRGPQRPTG